MDINERIKYLRKEYLKMNQTDFSALLGMKQTSVSTFEKSGASVTDQTIKGICLAVKGLNEEWLRDGTGEMFIEPDEFSLDDFIKAKGATKLETQIIKAYFELSPDTRRDLIEHFKARLSADPVKAAEDAYIKSRSGSAPETGRSVSNTNGESAFG